MEPNWLNPREGRAWRAFMHAHHQLVVHLSRGLQESELSGADYEVLATLSGHEEGRMPAQELCATLGWEKSRLSHQVRGMQKDGLIGREPNPADARSTVVCLLPAGRAAVEKAAPAHVADVRRNFIDLFTPAELDTLAALNERILRHLTQDQASAGEDERSHRHGYAADGGSAQRPR
jgi:DNA-binding MarR family transcriptional regulator